MKKLVVFVLPQLAVDTVAPSCAPAPHRGQLWSSNRYYPAGQQPVCRQTRPARSVECARLLLQAAHREWPLRRPQLDSIEAAQRASQRMGLPSAAAVSGTAAAAASGKARGGKELSPVDWVQVVIVAGIGSVLEWLDFYNYSNLDSTIKAVFFHTETGYWTCFALAMAARPCGALLFGHIGDTKGRTRALMLGIILMAGSTLAIG